MVYYRRYPNRKTMHKPKLLYHASQNRNLSILEPRADKVRDPEEGSVVFATPDKVMASVFIVPTDDSWTNSGLFGGVNYFVCGDEEKFIKLDRGGAIYTLPSTTFINDPNKGLGKREWTSKRPVKPINKEEFDLGLEAMIEMGVQVYFISKEKFQELKRSSDHGNKILRESVSENHKRNKNIRELPKIE